MVYTKLRIACWAREGGVLPTWGNAAAGMPVTTTAKHQPFNPSKSLKMPLIKLGEEVLISSDDLMPLIIADTLKEPVEIEFPEMIFKDPFLLFCALTNKTETGAATWGDGNTGTIYGDFSVETYIDSIMVQYRIYDSSGGTNHLDYTALGGEITKYVWVAEKGKLLREKVSVKFMNLVANTQAFTSDLDFDDGAVRPNAAWDEDAPFHSKNVSYEWGTSAVGSIAIEKGTMTLTTGKAQEHTQESQVASTHYRDSQNIVFELDGFISDKDQFEEILKAYASKTKQTFEMIYNDAGSIEERKVQATQVYLEKFDFEGDAIPESGKPVKCKLIFKAGVADAGTRSVISFSGKWTSHVDPYHATSRRINVVGR